MKHERSLIIETSMLQRTLAISVSIISLVLLAFKYYPEHKFQLFHPVIVSIFAILSLCLGLFINKKTKLIQTVIIYLMSIVLIFLTPNTYIGECIVLLAISITIYYYSDVKYIIHFTFFFGVLISIVARYLSYQYNSLPISNVYKGYMFLFFLVILLFSIIYSLKMTIRNANKDIYISETEHKIATSIIGVLHTTGSIASLIDYNNLIQENISDKELSLTFLKQERILIDEFSTRIKELVSSYSSSFKENYEIVEIGELLNQTIVFIKTLRIMDKEVTIEFNQLSKPLLTKINVSGIKTALENIINNSFDELIKSDVKTKKIDIQLSHDKENINICITDNGPGLIGIDGPVPNSYFKPGKTTKPKGTGLGMYIAIEEILSNEGQLNISSTSSGLTMNISLKKIEGLLS